MKTEHQDKYREWLFAIANTRLVFNTMDSMEDFLGNHAIRSNGIKRVYNTLPKLRAAFRDLKEEASVMTDGYIELDELLRDYARTSKFYMKHFARRKEQRLLAKQLLTYHYEPHQADDVAKRIQPIFEQIESEEIDVRLLALMLLGALPGYESKDGDVENISRVWGEVMDFIDDFTKGCGGLFESLPAISQARGEENKCRLMLIYHTMGMLGIYASYADTTALYVTSSELKERRVDLDIEGYWNECGGRADDTCFWHIEESKDEGVFFATWWYKKSDNELDGLKHTMHLITDDSGRLLVYLLHPEAMRHHFMGLKFTDADHAWYSTDMPDDCSPGELPLVRALPSNRWKDNLTLTRVTDDAIIATYEKWLACCKISKHSRHCEYQFECSLAAITQEALYIRDELLEAYYRVPRHSGHGFEKIKIDDNVGILTIDGKRYLAFDDSLLYIPIDDAALGEYGITKADALTRQTALA